MSAQTAGRYVIRDQAKGTYLKHDKTDFYHPCVYASLDVATVWQTLKDAAYGLWTYVDIYRYCEIVDLDTGDTFVKDQFQRVVKAERVASA